MNPMPGPIAPTIQANGTATTPTAGANFVTTGSTVIKAGRYRIRFGYVLSGTQETAAANVRLKFNGGSQLDMPTGQTTASGNIVTAEVVADLNGSDVVALGAVATAQTGAVYTGWVVLERLT